MEPHYYHSCHFDLIGTCVECLTDHPGNWWVVNKEDSTTCCVPSPYDVKFQRALDVNVTDDCPEIVYHKAAGISLITIAVVVCVVAAALMGKWIYGRCCKKSNQEEEVVEIEMEALGRAAGNEMELERQEKTGGDSGDDDDADDEGSSPLGSAELNMLTYESDDELHTECVVAEMETAV